MEEVSRMYKGKLELVSICGAAKKQMEEVCGRKETDRPSME